EDEAAPKTARRILTTPREEFGGGVSRIGHSGIQVTSWACGDPEVLDILEDPGTTDEELATHWVNGGKPFLRLVADEEVLFRIYRCTSLDFTGLVLLQLGCGLGWNILAYAGFVFRYRFRCNIAAMLRGIFCCKY
ncbi:unnamed protein product, partial [Amoebophrya sp. A25]